MNIHTGRLTVSAAALVIVATLAVPQSAAQGNYPSEPVTMLVPSAPGGTTDLAARLLAEPLGKALGQPIVVENRTGANGIISRAPLAFGRVDGSQQYRPVVCLELVQLPRWYCSHRS